MKFIKRLLTGILALVLVLFVVSFFLSPKSHVERSATINASPDSVFAVLNNIKTYNSWMPWNQLDPNMKTNFFGPESGVGAGYSWESSHDNVGSGKLAIVTSQPGQLVATSMDFGENGTAMGGWKLSPAGGGTQVTWFMDSEVSGNILMKAVGKYFNLFMDKMVGPDFEKGLGNLKKVTEKK